MTVELSTCNFWRFFYILRLFLIQIYTYDNPRSIDVAVSNRHLSHPTSLSPMTTLPPMLELPSCSTCNLMRFFFDKCLFLFRPIHFGNPNFDVACRRHLSHQTSTSPDDIPTNFYDRRAREVIQIGDFFYLFGSLVRPIHDDNAEISTLLGASAPDASDNYNPRRHSHQFIMTVRARPVILAIFLHIFVSYSIYTYDNPNFDVACRRHHIASDKSVPRRHSHQFS